MKQKVYSGDAGVVAPLEPLSRPPDTVRFPLAPAINRCELAAVAQAGDPVSAGAVLAHGPALVLHASVPGVVARADAQEIALRRGDAPAPASAAPRGSLPVRSELPAFAREMGLVGMGGGMFPASIKLQASERIHTLVVNAVECEPGIQIDEALLLYEADTVRAGLTCLVETLGIANTVLAAKRTSIPRMAPFAAACQARLVPMPNVYPAGAEKLIVARLLGRLPPTGLLPMQLGYLVFSVASLWALGRRLLQGEPSIMRPLTLVTPTGTRNLLIPVGTSIRHVFESAGVDVEPRTHLIIAGGLMMGRRVDLETPILKGMNALFVQPLDRRLQAAAQPCILCGACFDACPLRLHPIGMANRIEARQASAALSAQLSECFLCGACAAVCPASIPLVRIFQEGKQWLRK